MALGKAGVPRRACSHWADIYHDVLPAQSIGLADVWVNRPSRVPGSVQSGKRKENRTWKFPTSRLWRTLPSAEASALAAFRARPN